MMQAANTGSLLQNLSGSGDAQALGDFTGQSDKSSVGSDSGDFKKLIQQQVDATAVSDESPEANNSSGVVQATSSLSNKPEFAALGGNTLPNGNLLPVKQNPLQAQLNPALLPANANPSSLPANANTQALLNVQPQSGSAEQIGAVISEQAKSGPHDLNQILNELVDKRRSGSNNLTGLTHLTPQERVQTDSSSSTGLANRNFLSLLEPANALGSKEIPIGQTELNSRALLASLKSDRGSQVSDVSRVDGSVSLASLSSNVYAKPELSITAPVANQSAWQQSLGEKVMWMVGNNVQEARIRLNPSELGPLEVKISMREDQASIAFTSVHHQIRDILESALPRLREMMEESGLDLADVDVSDNSHDANDQALSSSDQDSTSNGATNNPVSSSEDDMQILEQQILSGALTGRIDLFA